MQTQASRLVHTEKPRGFQRNSGICLVSARSSETKRTCFGCTWRLNQEVKVEDEKKRRLLNLDVTPWRHPGLTNRTTQSERRRAVEHRLAATLHTLSSSPLSGGFVRLLSFSVPSPLSLILWSIALSPSHSLHRTVSIALSPSRCLQYVGSLFAFR